MNLVLLITLATLSVAAAAPANNEEPHVTSDRRSLNTFDVQIHVFPKIENLSKRADFDANFTAPAVGPHPIHSELNQLFVRLTGYISGSLFEFGRFDEDSIHLENSVTELTSLVADFGPQNIALRNQAQFLSLVFHDMKYALSLYKTFPSTTGPSSRVARNVFQLNVCFYSLRNIHGVPDPTIRDFPSKVRTYTTLLGNWQQLYNVEHTSPALDLIYWRQLGQARNTLKEISSYALSEAPRNA